MFEEIKKFLFGKAFMFVLKNVNQYEDFLLNKYLKDPKLIKLVDLGTDELEKLIRKWALKHKDYDQEIFIPKLLNRAKDTDIIAEGFDTEYGRLTKRRLKRKDG